MLYECLVRVVCQSLERPKECGMHKIMVYFSIYLLDPNKAHKRLKRPSLFFSFSFFGEMMQNYLQSFMTDCFDRQ